MAAWLAGPHQDNPVPKNMSTWPTRDELLAHFEEVAQEYGIMPYTPLGPGAAPPAARRMPGH